MKRGQWNRVVRSSVQKSIIWGGKLEENSKETVGVIYYLNLVDALLQHLASSSVPSHCKIRKNAVYDSKVQLWVMCLVKQSNLTSNLTVTAIIGKYVTNIANNFD